MYASDQPKKSDLIVSLGGGDGRRIKKALQLYKKGFSKSREILYTGREIVNPALPTRFSKSTFLLQGGVKKEYIGFVKRGIIVNTAEELFFIRDYMLAHHYKSVLIISAPVHTRRIKMLAHYITGFEKRGLDYTVSSFDHKKLQHNFYFLNPSIQGSVFLEFEKLIYNLLKYSNFTIQDTAYNRKKESTQWKNAVQSLRSYINPIS